MILLTNHEIALTEYMAKKFTFKTTNKLLLIIGKGKPKFLTKVNEERRHREFNHQQTHCWHDNQNEKQ